MKTDERTITVRHQFGETEVGLDFIPMADPDSGPTEDELRAMGMGMEVAILFDTDDIRRARLSGDSERWMELIEGKAASLSLDYHLTVEEAGILLRVCGPSGIAGHILATDHPLAPLPGEDGQMNEEEVLEYRQASSRWYEERWFAGSVWRRGDREDDEQ